MINPYKVIIDEAENMLVHVRLPFVEHLPPSIVPFTQVALQELLDQVYLAGKRDAEERAVILVGELDAKVHEAHVKLDHFIARHQKQ